MVWPDQGGPSLDRMERNTLQTCTEPNLHVRPEPGGPSPSCFTLVLILSASASGVATAEDDTGPQTLYGGTHLAQAERKFVSESS